jgi:hypothetical protein
VTKNHYIFGKNALQIAIFIGLPPYPLPKYMTGEFGVPL